MAKKTPYTMSGIAAASSGRAAPYEEVTKALRELESDPSFDRKLQLYLALYRNGKEYLHGFFSEVISDLAGWPNYFSEKESLLSKVDLFIIDEGPSSKFLLDFILRQEEGILLTSSIPQVREIMSEIEKHGSIEEWKKDAKRRKKKDDERKMKEMAKHIEKLGKIEKP